MEASMADVFFEVIQKLESKNIQYMIVGSVASMVYGEPRMTHDMDIVVEIIPSDVSVFEKLFPFEEYYCPPIEVIRTEVVHRGQFNLIHHGTGIKIDVMVRKNTAHAKEEFQRRRKTPFWQGSEVFLASPEDVILKKLSFYREGGSEKHLKDIRGMQAQSELDQDYLNRWIEELALQREWQRL